MEYNNNDVRRQDRLFSEDEARELLRNGEYGVLSMVDDSGDEPHLTGWPHDAPCRRDKPASSRDRSTAALPLAQRFQSEVKPTEAEIPLCGRLKMRVRSLVRQQEKYMVR